MNFKKWIIELFRDERGSTSIKPLIAFIGCIFLCGTMLIDTLTKHESKPSDTLVDAVVIITVIGMGADTLDKFSFKKKEE
jgi:hypothetical protein